MGQTPRGTNPGRSDYVCRGLIAKAEPGAKAPGRKENKMEKNEVKRWRVEYNHRDGRNGSVEVKTEIADSGAFDYGNGKDGALFIDGTMHTYDLRYNTEDDLHMEMIKAAFGRGLVKATEITSN